MNDRDRTQNDRQCQTAPDRTAVFTGTFDPLTLGHLDVIRRGSRSSNTWSWPSA